MECWWCSLTSDPMEPSRQRSVLWGGLVAFPQLLLVDWGAAQAKGGKQKEIGSCPAHKSGSKSTWRGRQSRNFSCWHQTPQVVHALCAKPGQWGRPPNICRRERYGAFLGIAAWVGLVHAPDTAWCLCLIINLFFDTQLARAQDLHLWLPLDDFNQPKSAWIY